MINTEGAPLTHCLCSSSIRLFLCSCCSTYVIEASDTSASSPSASAAESVSLSLQSNRYLMSPVLVYLAKVFKVNWPSSFSSFAVVVVPPGGGGGGRPGGGRGGGAGGAPGGRAGATRGTAPK